MIRCRRLEEQVGAGVDEKGIADPGAKRRDARRLLANVIKTIVPTI